MNSAANSSQEQAKGLADYIRRIRLLAGMSVNELAKKAEVDRSYVYRLEEGKYAHPTPERLTRLARALGIEVQELFAIVGYVSTTGLPELPVYLRAKYGATDSEAEELTRYLNYLRSQRPPDENDQPV